MKPLLAVRILAYNHENSISQCIESVLMQETDFDFKIVIGEDCSSDNTPAICDKYAKSHPSKIILRCNTQNDLMENSINNFDECKRLGAKYLAFLDGDDYWSDRLKLQKQVDFMESNEEFTICYHKTKKMIRGSLFEHSLTKRNADFDFGFFDSLQTKNGNTLSMVLRAVCLNDVNLREFLEGLRAADWAFECLATLKGRGRFLADEMGVYRAHNEGMSNSFSPKNYFIDRWTIFERLKPYANFEQKKLLRAAKQRILFWFFLKSLIAFKLIDLRLAFRHFLKDPFVPFSLMIGNKRWKKYFDFYYFPKLALKKYA